MCGRDTIDLISYDGKDQKVKEDIEKLRAKLQRRQKEITDALDEIQKKFGS